MTTASKIYIMVYKMVIFDENNKSIQIKRFFKQKYKGPTCKILYLQKSFFFENFDHRATLSDRRFPT